MTRWLTSCAVLVAFGLGGCNAPRCGAGTQQLQQKDGTLVCLPADALPGGIPCDADAGVMIVGGRCVSNVRCGDGTMYDPASGQCLGTGVASRCPTPMPGTACVFGNLYNLVDNTPYSGTVHVALYNPLDFLQHPTTATPLGQADSTDGTFVFNNVTPPTPQPIVAVATGSPGDAVHVMGGTAGGIVANQKVQIDGYVVDRATVVGWKASGSADYLVRGAYLARFYADTPTPLKYSIPDDKRPVASVSLVENGAVPADVRYFSAGGLGALDGSLTATSASGAALVPSPPPGPTPPSFSGTGGGITWELQLGGSVPGVVFVARLHAMQ